MEDFKGIATRSSHKDVRQTLAKIFMPDPLVAGGDLRVSWWVFTQARLRHGTCKIFRQRLITDSFTRRIMQGPVTGFHPNVHNMLSQESRKKSVNIFIYHCFPRMQHETLARSWQKGPRARQLFCANVRSRYVHGRFYCVSYMFLFLIRHMIYVNLIYITLMINMFINFAYIIFINTAYIHHIHQFTQVLSRELWHMICDTKFVLQDLFYRSCHARILTQNF